MKKILFGLGTIATVIAPITAAIACGSGEKDSGIHAYNIYSDKATNLNSLIGLAYKIEVANTPATADRYDVKDMEHGNALLNKQIDSLHKHTEQQHGQLSTDIVTTFGQKNLDAIYALVETIYGSDVKPVYTTKVDVVGRAVEAFNKSNFTLPSANQLDSLGFSNIKKYTDTFKNWTNRHLKLEIVARKGNNYQVVKTEAEAKNISQDLKFATWPTHKDNTVAIYDGEFIVRVVA